jgi:pimeloyl-ACP methyl ester carboxylesterase
MIVILPGFGRVADELRRWTSLLPGRVEILPLPPARGLTVDDLAAHYAASIPAEALIVGESFGGLIALAMAGCGYRAVAVDPPLTTQKQWAVQYGVRTILARLPADHAAHDHAANVLGVMPDGTNEERVYYPLLDALKAPVDLVTGSVPLWPYRGAGLDRACCLDGVDRFILARYPMVTLREVRGSHVLLDTNPEACRAVIVAAQAETLRA